MNQVHILGAGAMGCLWAAHLHLSDNVSRPAPPDQNDQLAKSVCFLSTRNTPSPFLRFHINSDFLTAIKPSKTLTFPVKTASTLDSPVTTLLVCTKSYDSHPALNALKHRIDSNTQIILFQNGLGSQFKIIEAFPDNPIFAAVTTEGANKQLDSTVIHAGQGVTRLGPLNASASASGAFEQCFKRLSHEGLIIEKEQNIWAALWHKLSINCAINPFTALLNCRNGDVKNSELFRSKWPELKIELVDMLEAAGYPISHQELESLIFDVMKKTELNFSSMLQDIRKQSRTEIDDINGFAHRFLSSNNLPSSANQQLWKDVTSLQK